MKLPKKLVCICLVYKYYIETFKQCIGSYILQEYHGNISYCSYFHNRWVNSLKYLAHCFLNSSAANINIRIIMCITGILFVSCTS